MFIYSFFLKMFVTTTILVDTKLIEKCCPKYETLNGWYECIEGSNNDKIIQDQLMQVGITHFELRMNDSWKKCPMSNRKEYEVKSKSRNFKSLIFIMLVLGYKSSCGPRQISPCFE